LALADSNISSASTAAKHIGDPAKCCSRAARRSTTSDTLGAMPPGNAGRGSSCAAQLLIAVSGGAVR
jgi:hypothetical protein